MYELAVQGGVRTGCTGWCCTYWLYRVLLFVLAVQGGVVRTSCTGWCCTYWLYRVLLFVLAVQGGVVHTGCTGVYVLAVQVWYGTYSDPSPPVLVDLTSSSL